MMIDATGRDSVDSPWGTIVNRMSNPNDFYEEDEPIEPLISVWADGVPLRFVLQRDKDISGVSGTGCVAWGVLFPDGTVTTRWNASVAQTCVWSRLEDVLAVHGHEGATRIVWIDDRFEVVEADDDMPMIRMVLGEASG